MNMKSILNLLGSIVLSLAIPVAEAAAREYWVAAEQVTWNYAPSGTNLIDPAMGLGVWGKTMKWLLHGRRYLSRTYHSIAVASGALLWPFFIIAYHLYRG
jgi:hypothetical protein